MCIRCCRAVPCDRNSMSCGLCGETVYEIPLQFGIEAQYPELDERKKLLKNKKRLNPKKWPHVEDAVTPWPSRNMKQAIIMHHHMNFFDDQETIDDQIGHYISDDDKPEITKVAKKPKVEEEV